MQVEGLSDLSFKSSTWSANRFCPGSHFLHFLTLRGEKSSATTSAKIIATNIACVCMCVHAHAIQCTVYM